MSFGKPAPLPWQQGRKVLRQASAALNEGGVATFGITALDSVTPGLRAGDFTIVAGPSHGFKSQLMVNVVLRNPDSFFVWVSPDESVEFVLQKLICAMRGLSTEEYDSLLSTDPSIFDDDVEAIESHVAIIDSGSPEMIRETLEQAVAVFGQVHVLIFDYVELLELGDSVKPKMDWLKKVGTRNHIAVVAIHQSTKLGLDLSVTPTLGMLNEAGHAHAFLVLWMKRPFVDADDTQQALREDRQPSVECWVLKNKRGRTLYRPVRLAVENGGVLASWSKRHETKALGIRVRDDTAH